MNSISLNPSVLNTIELIIKSMTILALVVYMLFAFILISQVKIKRKTLATDLGPLLELFSYIHFGLSIALIVLSFIIL